MSLVRLDSSTMREPILDLGCGRRATLVHHLRARNLRAYGIDRNATERSDFLTKSDWLDFNLRRTSWGTIVSNLGFTNHFVYCQKFDRTRVPGYARRYREILDSLIAGGSFVYAPGVEILEDELGKEEFTVDRWPISAQFTATKVTRRAPEQGAAREGSNPVE